MASNLALVRAQQKYLKNKNLPATAIPDESSILNQPNEVINPQASVFERVGETTLDILGHTVGGISKGLEGIVDFTMGGVGLIGGIFDKEFQKSVEEIIKYDFTQENLLNPLGEITRNSYINDASVKAQKVIRGIASGVGQIIPAAAVAVATGGAGAASMLTFGAGAAGSGVEEALNENATLGQSMAYGTLVGALETGIERLGGAIGSQFLGKGVVDDVINATIRKKISSSLGRNIVKAGIGALGEGAEEALSEAINPLLKLTYKPINEIEMASLDEIIDSFIIGAGTSLAYGGTLGRIGATQRNIASNVSEYQYTQEKLYTEPLITQEQQQALEESLEDISFDISYNLKKLNPNTRLEVVNRLNESGMNWFNEDGSIDYDRYSAHKDYLLVNQIQPYANFNVHEVNNDIQNKILETVRLYESFKNINKNMPDMVFDNLDTNIDGYFNPKENTLYININGKSPFREVLKHELTHGLKGTEYYQKLLDYSLNALKNSNEYDSLRKQVENQYANELNNLDTQERENYINEELLSIYSERLFNNQNAINTLVNKNRPLAQRIYSWIKGKINRLTEELSPEDVKLKKELTNVERLYTKALQKQKVVQDETRYKVYANRGYRGYSMSNRAFLAYEQGEKPISKYTKNDVIELSEFLKEKNILDFDVKNLSVKDFKEWLKSSGSSSWHHTSLYANETNFYSPYYSLFEETDVDVLKLEDRNDLIMALNLDNLETLTELIGKKEEFTRLKEEQNKLWDEERKNKKYKLEPNQIKSIDTDSKNVKFKLNSSPSVDSYLRAKKHFGTTNVFSKAGYINVDGTMLNFSGYSEGVEHDYRVQDHREISDIYDDLDGVEAMMSYLDEGNIRLKDNIGFELAKMPTTEQMSTLRRYINQQQGEIVLDLNMGSAFDDRVESFKYPKGTASSKILNDITKFYQDGTKPQLNDININMFKFKKSDNIPPNQMNIDDFENLDPNYNPIAKVEKEVVKTAPSETKKKTPPKSGTKTIGTKESRFQAKSVPEWTIDNMLDKETVEKVKEMKSYYVPETDKKSLEYINRELVDLDKNYETYVENYITNIENNNIKSKKDIALGIALVQESVKRKDWDNYFRLSSNLTILGTELGQQVQAFSLLNKLTSDGKLYTLKQYLKRENAKRSQNKQINISQELETKFLEAKTETEKQKVYDKIIEDVANQMPATTWEKLIQWRYLSMLANPKTHVRNFVGNTVMRGLNRIKNRIATWIENKAIKMGKMDVKDKVHVNPKLIQKATKEFAKQDANEVLNRLSSGSKFAEVKSAKDAIQQERQIFKNKTLESIRKFNFNMLEKADILALKKVYQESLAEWITAKGLTAVQIKENQTLLEQAREYAIKQAQRVTFREFSYLANVINNIKTQNKLAEIAVGGVVPFTKTPINILKTGINYSPLGFANTFFIQRKKLLNNEININDFVNSLSENLTGSMVFALGMILARLGLVSSGGDEDKEGKYRKELGEQPYSIIIGNKSYTLDWIAPASIPLFMGVKLQEALENNGITEIDGLIGAIASASDPLTELSMLSSLNDTLRTYQSNRVQGMVTQTIKNFIAQHIPTLSSQIAKTIDPYRRTTAVTGKENRQARQYINYLKSKIPFLNSTLPPYINVWGNEEKDPNILNRALENMVYPFWVAENNINTPVDNEIMNLFAQTDNKDIIPYIPNSYYTVNGERYDMTPDEYTQYKIDFGKFNYSQLESLFASDFYKNLTTEQKEEAITKVYSFGRDYARKGKYYELYQLLGNNSKNLSTYLLTINSFTADLDDEGNPIPNSKKLKVFKYINSLPLSKLAKNKLFELAGYSTTSMQQDETQPKKIIRPRR